MKLRTNTNRLVWTNPQSLSPKSYKCAFCNQHTGPNTGYYATGSHEGGFIYICTYCNRPTFFDSIFNEKIPEDIFGNSVKFLPPIVENVYQEARNCCGINSYTAVVMLCRKILMNISVEKGAKQGLSFVEYVNFLESSGFIPPGNKEWAERLRKQGNEANHEIHVKEKKDAEELMTFAEMLLKFVYEFPNSLTNN